MELMWRAAAQDDFDTFYKACYFRDYDNVPLRGIVAHEWRVLLENPTTLSMVVEDNARPKDQRLLGCAQLVFVTERFVHWAKNAPSPGGNVQATQPLPDGSWPLLTVEEIGAANAGVGLNALFTRWARANALLTREEQMEVGRYMHDSFILLTRGYQFREILIDVIGKPAREIGKRAGFLDQNRYEDHFQVCPMPPAQRPFLMGLTRQDAFAMEGCVMSHYFTHSLPRFGFSSWEQDILILCQQLPNATNQTLAASLRVSLSSVKNGWASIYSHVQDVAPDLLPSTDDDNTRGPEKRRALLQYLRDHPEELRPYRLS